MKSLHNLRLTAGHDARTNQTPDLWVSGGAVIEKTLRVGSIECLGSIKCSEFLANPYMEDGVLDLTAALSTYGVTDLDDRTGPVKSEAMGKSSTAIGSACLSRGIASHSQGGATQAIGEFSHAEGLNSKSIGIGSHSEGLQCISSGRFSHAEGWDCISVGDCSHACGKLTTSTGMASTAFGIGTQTHGEASVAMGYAAQTLDPGQFSHGAYPTFHLGAQYNRFVLSGTSTNEGNIIASFSIPSSISMNLATKMIAVDENETCSTFDVNTICIHSGRIVGNTEIKTIGNMPDAVIHFSTAADEFYIQAQTNTFTRWVTAIDGVQI